MQHYKWTGRLTRTSTISASADLSSYIRFECDEPDFDSFPEAELLEWMLVHSEVQKIEEFYVYTGEEYEEVINPKRIESMSFAFDGRIFTIPESLLSRYHFE